MLSPERMRRLAELRAKYPKPEPEPKPEHHTAYLTVSLKFDFMTMTQEEAEKAAWDWVWHRSFGIGSLLLSQYGKDGLRDVSMSQTIKPRDMPEEPSELSEEEDDVRSSSFFRFLDELEAGAYQAPPESEP